MSEAPRAVAPVAGDYALRSSALARNEQTHPLWAESSLKHRFEFGQHVRVTRDIKNDGSVTERKPGVLLLRRGAQGYVRDVNALPGNTIYYVDFVDYGYSVGCREQDLEDAESECAPGRYQMRDTVTLMAGLSVHGKLIAPAGATGEIVGIAQDQGGGTHYHVRVKRQTFLVPEGLLDSGHEEVAPSVDSHAPSERFN